MAHIFFGINAIGALCGWLAFNFVALSLFKDQNEKTFKLQAYAQEHWDNWIGSLLAIPAFLFIGAKGFNFEDIGVNGIKWSDGYYVLSGFAFEFLKIVYKNWKNKNGNI
jgi:hypothetical protein